MAISEADIALLVALNGRPGPAGARGPAGAAGPAGPAGPPGPGGAYVTLLNERWVAPTEGNDGPGSTGAQNDPFATIAHAVADLGVPTTQAEFLTPKIIHVVGDGAGGGPLLGATFPSGQWTVVLSPGIFVTTTLQLDDDIAEHFLSGTASLLRVMCDGESDPEVLSGGGATINNVVVTHAGANALADVHVILQNVDTIANSVATVGTPTGYWEAHGGRHRGLLAPGLAFAASRARLGAFVGADALTVLGVMRARDCAWFYGATTVSNAVPGGLLYALVNTTFAVATPSWTGPASSLVMDRATAIGFRAVGGTLGGGATVVVVDEASFSAVFAVVFTVTDAGVGDVFKLPPGGLYFANAAAVPTTAIPFCARRPGTFTLRSAFTRQAGAAGSITVAMTSVTTGGATASVSEAIPLAVVATGQEAHSLSGSNALHVGEGDIVVLTASTIPAGTTVSQIGVGVDFTPDYGF